MRTNELGKDITENIQENIKCDFEDTTNQDMTESNPAFLKYLKFKCVYTFKQHQAYRACLN